MNTFDRTVARAKQTSTNRRRDMPEPYSREELVKVAHELADDHVGEPEARVILTKLARGEFYDHDGDDDDLEKVYIGRPA